MITNLRKYLQSRMSYLSSRDDGNALFLILIAVTLFAALSYAVTQSNRGSSSNTSEAALVSGSTITQYPAGLRTGITRMLIKGVATSELEFNPPGSFSATHNEWEAFHPSGGGVSFQEPGPDMTLDDTNTWIFDKTTTVTNIGSTAADIVTMLSDIPNGVCRQINNSITGSDAIPVLTGVSEADLLGGGQTIGGTDISSRPFLCIETSDGTNVYYHVLVEL